MGWQTFGIAKAATRAEASQGGMRTCAPTEACSDMCLAAALLKSDTVPRGQQPASEPEPSGHALGWKTFSITKAAIWAEASQGGMPICALTVACAQAGGAVRSQTLLLARLGQPVAASLASELQSDAYDEEDDELGERETGNA